MKAILCDITALEYWRHVSAAGSDGLRMFALTPADLAGQALPRECSPVEVDPPTAELDGLLEHHGLASPDRPAHVLVTQRKDKRNRKGIICRQWAHDLPEGSLFPAHVGGTELKDIYVASPELALLGLSAHASDEIGLVTLAQLIMELSGTYRLAPESFVSRCPAITTPRDVAEFASLARGRDGSAMLGRAARFARSNAASPAETALALALSLPPRMGGANLRIEALNPELTLTGPAARMLGRNTISPDILLVGADGQWLAVEYDSKTWHDGREQADYDERRRNAYAALGLKCIVVRPRHLSSSTRFNTLVDAMRKVLGVRARNLTADYYSKCLDLQNELFACWRQPRS